MMVTTMSEKEAVELADFINGLIDKDKYYADVTTNWCGNHFVGVGKADATSKYIVAHNIKRK